VLVISIVPLAGPDFVHSSLGIKPLISVDGEPLLKKVITSRPWWRDGSLQPANIIFVLRDIPETSNLIPYLDEWFPGAKRVFISSLTSGALMSALAGVSLVKDFDTPLCIDLVDIIYNSNESILDFFADKDIGGVVPYFTSSEPCYSYFTIDDRGLVTQAREKQVISQNASAGTYFFRDTNTFLQAAAFSLANREELSVKGILFVCPAMNFLIDSGLKVMPFQANEVRSISKIFHE
jgi:hypothetical protein